jgi:hypothetical protein
MRCAKRLSVSCARGNICIIEDQATGLIYHEAFCPELMAYETHYNNEQGMSAIFSLIYESC